MKNIIFRDFLGKRVITIPVNIKKKKLGNIIIASGREEIASIYCPEAKKISYQELENLLSHYCDKNTSLENIIEHIEKEGFYTPYRPTLRISIEDVSL